MAGDKGSQSMSDAIEALGFGRAQIHNLCLAHGIWLVEACQVGLANALTDATAEAVGLSKEQKAALTSMIFVGIAIGSLLGGYIGDNFGRLPAILASYAFAFVVQLAYSFANSFLLLLILRICLGMAHGVGMPTSLALVSETAPASKRNMLMGLRGIAFACGSLTSALIIVSDDPSLAHLQWRADIIYGAIPAVVLGFAALCLLNESPIFLAFMGRHAAADEVLATMRRMNGTDSDDHAEIARDNRADAIAQRVEPSEAGGRDSKFGWQEQLKVVFNRHMLPITLTLVLSSFTCNVILYGHQYAFPQVVKETNSNVLAGYQILTQALVGATVAVVLAIFTLFMGLKVMLVISTCLGVVGPLFFAYTGSILERSQLEEIMYFISQNSPSVICGLGFLACFQMSVNLYPSRTAATSAAVCVAAGRLGSILAPFAFEACREWRSFYYMMAFLSGMTLMMTLAFLPGDSVSAKTMEDDAEASLPIIGK